MNSAFWSGRKVLVTGHTGFKGSWLCMWLDHLGADVVGYALEPPTQPSLFVAASVARCLQMSAHGDVRDLEPLSALIRSQQPDVIFHLAAQSVVRSSYDDPLETYSTNVLGTATLFQAIRGAGRRLSVVNVTTDKVYRNHEWIWGYRENDELGGRDPYSNSKACAELVTEAFRESYFPASALAQHGVALASARAGNVIGGGDWTRDQLIPDIIRAFTSGRPVQIRQPNSTRPWQHVLDCLSGYIMLAEKLSADGATYSTAWNFGPRSSDVKAVAWIADFLVRAWGGGASWAIDGGAHPHEARSLRLDSSNAMEVMGWTPRLDLPRALDWTAKWYKALNAGDSARELCLQQIKEYEATTA